MAIVKLQNGNVLLKDGKVSCSCCASVGCCMYPAQALVDGLYTYEDLPDAIDVADVVFTKIDPPESVAGFTRYYVNANDEYLGILDGEEESLWSYEGGGGPCLINGYNGQGGEREDQFADGYAINGAVGGWGNDFGLGVSGYVVSRIDLCTWTGSYDLVYVSNSTSTESGTSQIKLTLFYSIEESISEPYWGISFDYKDWNVTDNLTGQPVPEPGSTFTKKKIPIPGFGISSPAGDYYAGEGTGQWIVS